MDTMAKIKRVNDRLHKEMTVYENGEKVKGTVIDLFREEYMQANNEVDRIITEAFGGEEKYLFYILFNELCCPQGTELAWDHIKPLVDLKLA